MFINDTIIKVLPEKCVLYQWNSLRREVYNGGYACRKKRTHSLRRELSP